MIVSPSATSISIAGGVAGANATREPGDGNTATRYAPPPSIDVHWKRPWSSVIDSPRSPFGSIMRT